MKTIDWHSDPWFSEHHAGHISAAFKAWWLSHYGTPEDYADQPDEQAEYWQRCAFAWMGWKARSAASPPYQVNDCLSSITESQLKQTMEEMIAAAPSNTMKTLDVDTIINACNESLKAGDFLVIGARPNQGRMSFLESLGSKIISSPHCPPDTAFFVDTHLLAKLAEKTIGPYIEELNPPASGEA